MVVKRWARNRPFAFFYVSSFFSIVLGDKCDHYSFCDRPHAAHVHMGNFEFGETFEGKSCVATQARAASFSLMTLNNSHANGTITTSVAVDNNDYTAAVGARLEKTDYDLDTSVCRGYTGYWCYIKAETSSEGRTVPVTLEMKKCGTTSMTSLTKGDFTYASTDLDTFAWYDLKFQLIGNHLACKLLHYSDRGSDDYLASIETSDNDFTEVGISLVIFIFII